MSTCLYEAEPDEANPADEGLPRIETRSTVQTWLPGNPVIPGSIWCWTHGQWEKRDAEKAAKEVPQTGAGSP